VSGNVVMFAKTSASDNWKGRLDSSTEGFLILKEDVARQLENFPEFPNSNFNELSELEIKEMEKGLEVCKDRINNNSYLECKEEISRLTQTKRSFHWLETGLVLRPQKVLEELEEEKEAKKDAPPSVFPLIRANNEKLPVNYNIGEFLVVRTEKSCVDPFWIGRITKPASDKGEFEVQWYDDAERKDHYMPSYFREKNRENDLARSASRHIGTVLMMQIMGGFETLNPSGTMRQKDKDWIGIKELKKKKKEEIRGQRKLTTRINNRKKALKRKRGQIEESEEKSSVGTEQKNSEKKIVTIFY